MPNPTRSHLRAYTALLLILIVLVGFFYALYSLSWNQSTTPSQSAFPPSAPMPTLADETSAQQSFQYIVSYTVSGFHPTSLSMKTGETVRFSNNGQGPLIIDGSVTSPQIVQGGYWQYTATTTGAYTFTAGSSSMKITVTK